MGTISLKPRPSCGLESRLCSRNTEVGQYVPAASAVVPCWPRSLAPEQQAGRKVRLTRPPTAQRCFAQIPPTAEQSGQQRAARASLPFLGLAMKLLPPAEKPTIRRWNVSGHMFEAAVPPYRRTPYFLGLQRFAAGSKAEVFGEDFVA